MTPGRQVFLIILAGTAVRLVFAASTGLGYDESYMVGNARDLAIGYVDHPPLHVWLAGLSARLFDSEAPIAVRLPFVLLFAGSTWLMAELAGRMFDRRAGLWAAAALTLAPVFSLSDGVFVLPDGPTIFFLLAAALFLARILFHQPAPERPVLWWLMVGLLAGLALLSKFNAAFFPLAAFVYLVTVPSARRHLATPGPWLAALVTLVVLSPALLWNAEHGMVGFAFQAHRVGGSHLRLDYLAQQVGGQLLYLTPWLAVPFAVSLWRALVAGPRAERGWLLALAAIGPITVFTLLALLSRGLPHWTMPGWLFVIALFGRDSAELEARRPVFARRYMAGTAVVFVVLLGAGFLQATRGGLLPSALADADPTIDLVDWTDLKTALTERGLLSPGQAVGASKWMLAGKVRYALGPGAPVLCLCDEAQRLAFHDQPAAWIGKDVVLVVPRTYAREWAGLGRYFDAIDDLPPVEVTRAGAPVLTLDLKMGKNLRIPAK